MPTEKASDIAKVQGKREESALKVEMIEHESLSLCVKGMLLSLGKTRNG